MILINILLALAALTAVAGLIIAFSVPGTSRTSRIIGAIVGTILNAAMLVFLYRWIFPALK